MPNRLLNTAIQFPQIPKRWGEEENRFAQGLRELIENIRWQKAWPIGIVAFSTRKDEHNNPVRPFTFGEWEQITTNINGVYAWKRVK
jgi:hypothetical protein